MINIFITLAFVLVWPVFYFMLRCNVKPKKNIILGVTLPPSTHKDLDVLDICNSFIKGLNIVMLPLLLLALPPFFMNLTGAVLTWVMCWVLVTITVPYYVFAKFRSMLISLKQQRNWHSPGTGEQYPDEDQYWIWGLFYHNPNNNHFLVKNRIGMNMTVNLAKPAAKLLMIFTAMALLAMPFFGIWLLKEELTPIRLILSETTLTARHTNERYVIQLNTIESFELIETLPSMIRVAGTGMENLYKGNFRVEGYGTSRVRIHPKEPPFLAIREGGFTYIINDAESTVTREVYEVLKR